MNKQRLQNYILAVVVPVLVGVSGCGLFHKLNGFSETAEEQVGFNHKLHVSEEEITCDTCHTGYSESAQAGMPTSDTCKECHDTDDEDMQAFVGTLLTADGEFIIRKRIMVPDLIFDHKLHVVDNEIDCNECHQDIENSEVIGKAQFPSMEGCFSCHDDARQDCTMCHSEISGPDFMPDNHRQNWLKFHGQEVRDQNYDFSENKCNVCHDESTCAKCHQEEAPQNHTAYWRQVGHGKFLGIDREGCATCHATSFCVKCHEETRPRNHQGAWAGQLNTHCLNCHVSDIEENGCALCHKEGTPGHALATDQPANHVPGMNCRQCHGNGQPLPHVDKGDDCTLCHK